MRPLIRCIFYHFAGILQTKTLAAQSLFHGAFDLAVCRLFGDLTPLVVLATARRQADRLPSGEFVAKPYHYGPLIRRIEELLGL